MENFSTIINTPTDLAKKSFDKFLEKNKTQIISLDYINTEIFDIDNDYALPNKNRTIIIQFFNRVLSINIDKQSNKIKIKKLANFEIISASEIQHIYNNKSYQKTSIYYQITLKSDKGVIKTFEITGSAKTDYKELQKILSEEDNNFQAHFKLKEYLTYVEKYILPNLKNHIIIYENCGVIGSQKLLGDNFLATKDKIYLMNEDGVIPTEDENTFIKPNQKNYSMLPKLAHSQKSVKEIANEFIKNVESSYGENAIYMLLIVGHIIMGPFFESFIYGIGVPSLIICGISGCGKSTIIKAAMGILGFDEKCILSGDSTPLSICYTANSINSMGIFVDDLSNKILTSLNFNNLLKKAFNGIKRRKMKNYGKESDDRQICSQLVFSTNGAMPEIPELENRANVFTIMKNSFDSEKFLYFDNTQNREELSLILPELIKYDDKYVVALHEQLKEILSERVKIKAMPRIIHNIAYMWTGLYLLTEIADYYIENIEEKIVEYANKVIEHYNGLSTPVDMLLDNLLALKNNNIISEEKQYKISQKEDKVLLIFHKSTLISAHNHYFRDEEHKIDEKIFNNYLKVDKRLIEKGKTTHYRDAEGTHKMSSVILDITNHPDVWEFTGLTPPIDIEIPKDKSNAETSTDMSGLDELAKLVSNIK